MQLSKVQASDMQRFSSTVKARHVLWSEVLRSWVLAWLQLSGITTPCTHVQGVKVTLLGSQLAVCILHSVNCQKCNKTVQSVSKLDRLDLMVADQPVSGSAKKCRLNNLLLYVVTRFQSESKRSNKLRVICFTKMQYFFPNLKVVIFQLGTLVLNTWSISWVKGIFCHANVFLLIR